MRRLLLVLLFVGAGSGLAADLLSPEAFADRFVRAIRAALPSVMVVMNGTEVLIKDPASGKNTALFLNNAYADYAQAPERLDDLLKSYVTALRQSRAAGARPASAVDDPPAAGIDRTRIVPVIKDRQWIDDNASGLKARGVNAEFVFDDLNKDLVVVYAEDHPARTRYLMSGDKPGVAREELRTLAIANLRRLLPKIEISQEDHVTLVSAGGDYDASLLLFDEIWSDGRIKVAGDIVVAIPARNVLLVTGSQDRAGLRAVRTLVAKLSANGSHALTRTLFVYRNGRFVKFGR